MTKRNKVLLICLLIAIVLCTTVLLSSYAIEPDGTVPEVTYNSDNYPDDGSWKIINSASWTSRTTVKESFYVKSEPVVLNNNPKDVIFVMDISSSMHGEKIDQAKLDAKELIKYLLKDGNSKASLITFASNANIETDLTNDRDLLLNKIDALVATSETNYCHALEKVDEILSSYQKQDGRDVLVLFMTDGYPTVDTPNEVIKYELLKENYPYITIHGIQYEMGEEIIDELKNVSDVQWSASQSNLYNILFEAALSPEVYDKFVVTNYVDDDYFIVNSVDDINVSM